MENIRNLELFSLLSDASVVTNEQMQTAYGDFVEKLRTVSKSEQDYSEIFRMLNNTRIELVALQTFYQHEQGEKCG